MNNTLIITIDGPAGVGKTTLARRTAKAVGCAYLDTGAMFRTLALKLTPDFFDTTQPSEVLEQRLNTFSFALEGTGEQTELLCNGIHIGSEIRTEKVAAAAAKIGQIAEVRAFLKKAQQRLGQEFSLVAEGRDMGTEVFPNASCKIFLDAKASIRAQRRFLQLQEMGTPANLDELTAQIQKRDQEDRNRSLAPLRPAADAHIIDTSELELEGVFAAIMRYAKAPANITMV